MEKVNKYKSDIIDSSIEYKHFILEMVNTMKALGTYTGINTKDFDNNFFIGRHATLKEPRGNFCLYCCNKNNNIFNLIYYLAQANEDIVLKRAMTFQLDINNGSFIYHTFENSNNELDLNIIHKKMFGILPYYVYNPINGYDVINDIKEINFNVSKLSSKSIEEIEDIIENTKNKKEYIDDQCIWELNPESYILAEEMLKTYSKNLYSEIKNMPLENAKKYIISHQNNNLFIEEIIYALELINHKNEYDKLKQEKIKKLIKLLKKNS